MYRSRGKKKGERQRRRRISGKEGEEQKGREGRNERGKRAQKGVNDIPAVYATLVRNPALYYSLCGCQ